MATSVSVVGQYLPMYTYLPLHHLHTIQLKNYPILPSQLSPENEPTDRLDGLALSILQEIGSTATTGM